MNKAGPQKKALKVFFFFFFTNPRVVGVVVFVSAAAGGLVYFCATSRPVSLAALVWPQKGFREYVLQALYSAGRVRRGFPNTRLCRWNLIDHVRRGVYKGW